MTPEQMKMLTDAYEAWLRVPKVTWDEWCALDQDCKAALLAAARRIVVDRVLLAAQALEGPEARARLCARIDGGESWLRFALTGAINSYEASRNPPRTPEGPRE